MAVSREEDIKGYYIDQYKQLHSSKVYGVSSKHLAGAIAPLVREFDSLLDYGCGQSEFVDLMPNKVKHRYDPAIPKYQEQPDPSDVDVVTCLDVMEHVPEAAVDEVLQDIYRLSDKAVFVISLVEAACRLPNGEQAHTTVKPAAWWADKIGAVFGATKKHKHKRNGILFLTTF
jgi:hypothetical protein